MIARTWAAVADLCQHMARHMLQARVKTLEAVAATRTDGLQSVTCALHLSSLAASVGRLTQDMREMQQQQASLAARVEWLEKEAAAAAQWNGGRNGGQIDKQPRMASGRVVSEANADDFPKRAFARQVGVQSPRVCEYTCDQHVEQVWDVGARWAAGCT